MSTSLQEILFSDLLPIPVAKKISARSGSFIDNMKLPVHRWFRYSAGFSADWVVREIHLLKSDAHIFDPFAGSGTVLVAAEAANRKAIGQEAHPFVARIGRAKLHWRSDPIKFAEMADLIWKRSVQMSVKRDYPALLPKCYDAETLNSLEQIRLSLLSCEDDSAAWQLCWLAYVAILRTTSNVGTAQWQYILPNKSKANPREPLLAFRRQVAEMVSDMYAMDSARLSQSAELLHEDCRTVGQAPEDWSDLIITSPPYINNYDYADATRLEMTMLDEIQGWGDLQQSVRRHLVRSCTQQVAQDVENIESVLADPVLASIRSELEPIIKALQYEKTVHGGKKNYDAMVVHYFLDMAITWKRLRRIARPGSSVCFVIGDSAPYGVYVPVEKFHGLLALAAGFKKFEFKKLRDRNTKWKNRKHQVPLQEGQLWVHG